MFISYLKIAIRNITKNKFYSIINILGLAIGIASFIFILLFITEELSYDKYHEKALRIYRIESDFTISNKHDQFAIVPVPMAPALKIEFPEIESFVRFRGAGNTLIKYKDKEYYEDNFFFTDSTIFDVFTHEFVMGNPRTCLTEPYSIVFTEKTAKKYFGNENPMGEFIKSGSGNSYKITGVIKNLPSNSHLKFDALLSVSTLADMMGQDNFNSMEPIAFWNIGVYSYLLLNENSEISSIHEKFPAFYEKYMKPIGDQVNASFNLMSTPLADIHFSGNLSSDQPKGNIAYIYIFSAVALFILLIAAINYMNMATARSAKRAREVGIRKVAGAFKSQLIKQFLSESIVLTILALIIAIIIVYSLLPDFNTLSGKELQFDFFSNPAFFIKILLVSIVIGIISGSYPAFYLSSFMPVKVLKGSTGISGKQGGLLRKILVVFQFFIAIVMIIGTIVVSNQLNFLRNKDLGFDKDNLVVLELQDSTFRSKIETFKKELLNYPNILGVTNSTGIPGQNNWIQVVRIEKDNDMIDNAVILTQTDYDYPDVLGLEIVEGRNFDEKMGTDKEEAVLINETMARQYGWDEPLGKKIHYGFDLDGSGGRMLKVIGVVRDFHFNSLHNKIEPIIMFISPRPRYFLTVKINSNNFRQAIDKIEEKWNEFGASRTFNYNTLEDTWDEMYDAEKRLSTIFRIATILAIFIALLGLLGLSSFTAEQKTKEIGIRKIFGATPGVILGLLYKEFLILILIAFVLAIPVAWWRLDIWLNSSFIYRTNISVWSFLLAGFFAVIISMLTISFHAIKATQSNPIDSIKCE